MQGVEQAAVATGRVSLALLMERAGGRVAEEASRLVPSGPVAVVCGPGNNGGDGWVAARRLAEAGRDVRVVALRAPDALRGEAADAARTAIEGGVSWSAAESASAVAEAASDAACIIDAVFGFGLARPPEGLFAAAISAINDAGAPVVSVDLPSGVDADTGAVTGPAVRADLTVTFSAFKVGLLLYPGAEHAGEVVVADIGIPAEMLDVPASVEVPDAADLAALFPWPRPQDHKGSRGRVAVVAGSRAYSGAAVLAVAGALRMGPGYVVAVVPEPVAPVVRVAAPGVVVRAVPAAPDGGFASAEDVLDAVADADAVAAGPGLSTSPGAVAVAHALLRNVRAPLVLDADALNAFDGAFESLTARTAPLVITPHPGEAARLLGVSAADVQRDRLAAARRLAGPGSVCVLKGARTVVVGGGRSAVICAGNPGLARAGSGDVLTGMLGTLLAQRVAPYDAAVIAAYLHARAADHGVAELTETCFGAADITRYLPNAVRELAGG
jgi:NAD(P)H-hydrate epimerase